MSAHGGPGYNIALDQAGDYFRDTYGGRMVHLAGIVTDYPVHFDSLASPAAAAEDGFTVHAGLVEHGGVSSATEALSRPA